MSVSIPLKEAEPRLQLKDSGGSRPERPRFPKRALGGYEAFVTPWLGCWILGNLLGYGLPSPLNGWLLAGGLLILAGVVVYTERFRVIRAALLLTGVLLGLASFQWLAFQPGPMDISRAVPWGRTTVQGVVQELRPEKKQAVLAVQRAGEQRVSGQVVVYGVTEVPLAGTIRLSGDLQAPFESPVPGTFNQRRYLLDQGISAVIKKPKDVQVLNAEPATWQGAFLRQIGGLRDRILRVLDSRLPSPASEVVGGVVLGHHAVPLDDTTKQQFVHTGLIHILAASGLNVGIIAGFVMAVLTVFRVSLPVRLVAAMAAVALYSVLTGLPPSVQRAAAMLELALLLKLLNRKLTPLSLLLLATSALLLVNPRLVGSLGFQFSVLTTLGLITMVGPLQEWLGYYITRWAAGIILVPLVAQLWVLPLSLYCFNQLPLHSVPLNIAALLMVTPLTMLGFTAGVVALFNEWAAGWIAALCQPFAQGLLWLVAWGDGLQWAQWTVASPAPWMVAALYGLLFVAAWFLAGAASLAPVRKWLVFSGLSLLIVVGGVVQFQAWWQQTVVTAIPLSEARYAFLMKPARSSQHVLVVPDAPSFWEGRTLSDYLRHRNLQQLHALVMWPTSARFGKPVEAAGLRVLEEGRQVQHRFLVAEGVSASGALAAGQALRLGTVRLSVPLKGLFRIETPSLCLEGGAVADAASPCIQYLERTRDASHRPARWRGLGEASEPGFMEFFDSPQAGLRWHQRSFAP